MDCAGDQLLTCSGLSLDQHRGVDGGDFRHSLEDGLKFWTDSDYFIESITARQFIAKLLHLKRQVAHFERPVDDQQKFVVIERLGEVIKSAGFHRLDGGANRAVGGHHDAVEFVVNFK